MASLLLIRRRRPLGESAKVEAALADGHRVVEASIAGGRIAEVLAAIRPDLDLQGQQVLQWLPDLGAGPATVVDPVTGDRFATVVLASHLVNSADPDLRRALLGIAARQMIEDGRVLVEHHPLDWASTAAESWSEHGGTRLGMVDVRVRAPFVSAVSVYEASGRTVRQPFTARVLSERELDAALAAVGLRRSRRLAPTWLEARRAGAVS
jgi:hypothetical protein